MARIDCKACEKYSYDIQTGNVNTYEAGEGEMLPILRVGPPPCSECPKKSPANSKRLELSVKSRAAWDFYLRAKATPGMRSDLFQCPVVQRTFIDLDNMLERAKSDYAKKMQQQRDRDDG